MSIEIKGTVEGAEKVILRLNLFEQGMRERLRKVLNLAAAAVAIQAKTKYLDGDPLKRKTGTLRRSVQQGRVHEEKYEMSVKIGTNVVYGKPHEYGLKVFQHVRAHMRMTKGSMKSARRILRARKAEFGMKAFHGEQKQLARTLGISVRAFDRTIQFKERPFMRPALRDKRAEFIAMVKAAIAEQAKEASGGKHA